MVITPLERAVTLAPSHSYESDITGDTFPVKTSAVFAASFSTEFTNCIF